MRAPPLRLRRRPRFAAASWGASASTPAAAPLAAPGTASTTACASSSPSWSGAQAFGWAGSGSFRNCSNPSRRPTPPRPLARPQAA
eukprot:1171584-Lingulodinium_polyedra.AAC.1